MDVSRQIIVLYAASILFALAVVTSGQSSTTTPLDECMAASNATSCSDCVGLDAKCVWCPNARLRCKAYPPGKALPSGQDCPLSDARWLNCTVNFQILLIMMGVLAAVILIGAVCCCYCCCCGTSAASHSRRERRDEERARTQREARQARSSEKKVERQAKYDDIRRKYGIGGGGATSQYAKFDNEGEA